MRFAARYKTEFPNGSIGWAPGGAFDCLGPYARVQNCPVISRGAEVARLTVYATNYPDTWFSVPACTRRKGKYVTGFLTRDDNPGGGITFVLHDNYAYLFQ